MADLKNSDPLAPRPQEGGIAEVDPLTAVYTLQNAAGMLEFDYPATAKKVREAAAELSRLSAIVKAQKEALDELLPHYEAFIEFLGPCDHDTGKCSCKEQRALETARALEKNHAQT